MPLTKPMQNLKLTILREKFSYLEYTILNILNYLKFAN